MGCIKFAMGLLSTLAALVIIVHSEENYEQDYRELRPKPANVDAPYLEQSWRSMQVVPIMTQSPLIAPGDAWDDSNPDPPLRRRRPGRKRKRRPTASQEDDLVTEERYINPDASRPRRQKNIDTPRRRRKKIVEDSREGSRWTDEGNRDYEQRRGQKRKRTQTDMWPELSEFNDYRNYEKKKSAEDNTQTRIDDTYFNDHNINNDEEKKGEAEFDNGHETEFIDITTVGVIESDNGEQDTVQTNDDISLSEFSSEILAPGAKYNESEILTTEKSRHKVLHNYKDLYLAKAKSKQIVLDLMFGVAKSEGVEKIYEKIKIVNKRATKYKPSIIPFEEQLPLNPQTLKLILKKSNGKSLSEILQQNNLTLADLLRGKEKALTILQNEELESNPKSNYNKISDNSLRTRTLDNIDKQEANKNEYEFSGQENIDTETATLIDTTTTTEQSHKNTITRRGESALREQLEVSSEGPRGTKTYLRRRFPTGIRRKIRMRLMTNNTYKGQLSRDLIAQSSIKYKNNRNVSRPRDWKEFMPSRLKTVQSKTQTTTEHESHFENITTTTNAPQESTTPEIFETTTDPSSLHDNTEMPILNEMDIETVNTDVPITVTEIIQTTTENFEQLVTENIVVSEKSTISPIKPIINADLRRQVFNNRLKRKRLRHKVSSTESPDNVLLQQVFGESNYVSASEFITKSQTKTTNANEDDEFSTLEDFFTTESFQNERKRHKTKMLTSTRNIVALTTPRTITTEETAQKEIEEIVKDSLTYEKLTKILNERNMTLSELVAHRERGSSHLHLADIFHNASREPNPPEPFLTKSLIEPISKETYPLRALLEANLHDAKTTTFDPNAQSNLNIPVVMNFGNNVNEIGENMGIIALFKNFSKLENKSANESETLNEETSISNSHAEIMNTTRDGRSFHGDNDSVAWNDLITLIEKNQQTNNDVDKIYTTDITIPNTLKKTNTEGNTYGDGVIIFEDLQHLKNIDNKIDSDQLIEFNLYETNESPLTPVVTASPASNTKSVAVATLSIVGLALILFLLTYAALKWKQRSIMFNKKHSADDVCVPSPIFENRKTQKLNSSTRSMSPMLSTNIYTIDSLETRDGNESPEYMWDTLRKPYQ